MLSDNGSNFVGAAREINEHCMDQEKEKSKADFRQRNRLAVQLTRRITRCFERMIIPATE